MNRDIIAFTKYKFNVYGKKDIRSGRDSAVVGIVGKSKSLDFPTMLIFWSLVRNSVVLAVYLLFSVACFLTVHEHYTQEDMNLLMNHINSVKRPSLHGRCPYETVPEGDDNMKWLMELLKMDIIQPDDVHLKPSLFKR